MLDTYNLHEEIFLQFIGKGPWGRNSPCSAILDENNPSIVT